MTELPRRGRPDEARRLFSESRRRLDDVEATSLAAYLTFDEATIAALDRNLAVAKERLDAAVAQFAADGVVPDPDDAAEIQRLRTVLSGQTSP